MNAMDKVIGYDKIKDEMNRILDVLKNPDKYRKLGVNEPKGILLVGEPGIGKTLLAKCFAKESGRKTYIVRKDKPDGDFVNYIREVFDEAICNEPAIILLDDMDKFANEDSFHRDAEEYVTVQTCIDDVKERKVFVIATVNDRRCLPPSLTREGRFDVEFRMEFPTGKDAEKIIEYYLKNKNVSKDIDIELFAKFCKGYSCAFLETVINAAGINAGYAGREIINQEDLIQACLAQIYGTPEDENEMPEKAVLRCAIHEAGHVVVNEVLNPGSVTFATVLVNKRIGGFTSYEHEKGFYEDFENNEIFIMGVLGGKAAVEVVTGTIDMGANSDMDSAYERVTKLLDHNTAYDFNSWCHGEETSQNVYDHLDAGVGIEMARYYNKAKQILIKNRTFLDAVTKEIMDKKVISYKDIAKIKEAYR